jgi:hypothetical protein
VSPLEACAILGVSPADEWSEVRRAYRLLIRQAHPDLGEVRTGQADASAITAAFAVVSAAHDRGELPQLPMPERTGRLAVRDDVAVLALPIDRDPFVHLLDMAHRLGEVTYQDADAGLFQVLVTEPDRALYQLAGEIEVVDDAIHVQFTLEPLGPGVVPEIASVVSRFGRLNRTD